MKAVFLALLTLKAAYTVCSSDAELKAMLQENSLFGNLWEHPEFDSTLESIGNRKKSVTRVKSEEECALECTQTQDCAAFIVQVLCKRSRACKLIFKPGFDRTLNTPEKYFTLRYTSENEVQGAFYRPDTGSYHLVVGTLMVTYNTLADLINGNPQPTRGVGTLFPNFGKTVDDVLVRQVVNGQNSYLLFYLLNHNKCHAYRLDSQVGRANKASDTVEQLEFLKSWEYVDAAVELNHCQNCPNSPSRKAYFLLDGEHVYEAPGNTWLDSADGTLHGNKTFSGSPFPAELTAVTAAVKYDGSDEGLILFEGLKFYLYNMTNNLLQSLGEVDLCR